MFVKSARGRPDGRTGRKAEQSENTRRLLIGVARELFTERGYAGTATEEVVQRAGVTRGALYHQFRDKEDLFRAVYEDVERELEGRMAAGMEARLRNRRKADAWELIEAGNEAFLDACLDPSFQRIALLEAPSVLGSGMRSDVARQGLGMIRRGLEMAIDEGLMERQPIEPMAHLMRAVLYEGALLLTRSADAKGARAEIGSAVARLIGGLRAV